MSGHLPNSIMVVVYWVLTLFWVVVVSISVAYLIWRPLFHEVSSAKRTMQGFVVLAILFFLDSIYWAIANTARVGFISDKIVSVFYNSWAISTVKLSFLIAGVIFLITIIKTFQQIEDRVEASYFTQFADQSVDAIGVLSPRGSVVFWNRGAEDLYGHLREYTVGKHIKEFLVPPRLHQNIDKILDKIRDTGKAERFIAPRLKHDKTEVLVDITISPIIDYGHFRGYFGIMRPVAENQGKPSVVLTPHIEEVTSNRQVTDNSKDSMLVIQQLAEAMASEVRDHDRRQALASIIAVSLLLITGILIFLAIISGENHKYFFGSGSILTTVGEIWPIRYLIRNRRYKYTGGIIQRILNLPSMDDKRLKSALEIVDAVEQRMIRSIEADSSEQRQKPEVKKPSDKEKEITSDK